MINDNQSIEEFEKFVNACDGAILRYLEQGTEDAKRMSQAYMWMSRGARWTIGIILGEADAKTAFNDPIRMLVKGFSNEDSNEMIEMMADLWNHREDE